MNLTVEKWFKETIAHIIGHQENAVPLGGRKVKHGTHPVQNVIADLFLAVVSGDPVQSEEKIGRLFHQAKNAFTGFYTCEQNTPFLKERMDILKSGLDENRKARAVTEIWAPETAIMEKDILPKWRLEQVKPNLQPYRPEEIVLQLNALYTLPQDIPGDLNSEMIYEWHKVKDDQDTDIFHYDHPVPLFGGDDQHELLKCLTELDSELGFEKKMGVFRKKHKIPLVVSVSVTHPRIDHVCGLWLKERLERKKYHHLKLYVVTEAAAVDLKKAMGFSPRVPAVFSVTGQYANHFNLLKYFQLILERISGVRAGFKLDTDEGIRSRDLFQATGKTWFQTMCHEYWGGNADVHTGDSVYLGVIAGEYINEKDIQLKGYHHCLRQPDVTFDGNYLGPEIFFNKGVAHATATDIYNRRGETLEDFLSHPVVKGGGFGIDNSALKRFTPFTLSRVGRAEDQQFYMAGIAGGCRGIFTPDLRIAHYKQSQAVTEKLTQETRFLGDMYRLVIFQDIVRFLGIKDLLDPMPGVFAGPMARVQAFFSMLYKSYEYFADDQPDKGQWLFRSGFSEIDGLIKYIDQGLIRKAWQDEQLDWKEFVNRVARCDRTALHAALRKTEVRHP